MLGVKCWLVRYESGKFYLVTDDESHADSEAGAVYGTSTEGRFLTLQEISKLSSQIQINQIWYEPIVGTRIFSSPEGPILIELWPVKEEIAKP